MSSTCPGPQTTPDTNSSVDALAIAILGKLIENAPSAKFACDETGLIVVSNAHARKLTRKFATAGQKPCMLSDLVMNDPQKIATLLQTVVSSSIAMPLSLDFPTGTRAFRAWRVDRVTPSSKPLIQFEMDPSKSLAIKLNETSYETDIIVHRLGQAEEECERLRREARHLEMLSVTDPLTGVLNQAGFSQAMRRALESADTQGHLFFIDLDGFKEVNDTLGHPAGDAVLRVASRALSSAVRGGDLVGRMGGDEFALWIAGEQGMDLSELAHRIEQVIVAATEPLLGGHPGLRIAASVGHAVVPGDAQDYAALLKIADNRMYQKKNARKGEAG